jgi:hypothetical protein
LSSNPSAAKRKVSPETLEKGEIKLPQRVFLTQPVNNQRSFVIHLKEARWPLNQ